MFMHANSVYHSNRDRENTVENDSRTDRLAYGSSLLEGAEPILPCSSSPRQTCQSRSCPHRFRRAAVPGRNIWVLYSQRVTVQCHSVPCPAQILSWRSAPERSGIRGEYGSYFESFESHHELGLPNKLAKRGQRLDHASNVLLHLERTRERVILREHPPRLTCSLALNLHWRRCT